MATDETGHHKEPLRQKTTGSPIPAQDFQSLFESMPAPCLALSPDLRVMAANEAYLHATTTDREDIVGRGLFEIFPKEHDTLNGTDAGSLRASLDAVLKNRVTDVMAVRRYQVGKPGGETAEVVDRFWKISNTPVPGNDKNIAYIILLIEDVTDFTVARQMEAFSPEEGYGPAPFAREISEINLLLKRANEQLAVQNEKLRESEQRFASFMLNLPAVAWIKDASGKYVYVNSEAERVFPTIPELVGSTDFDLFPPDVARHFRETDRQVFAEGSIKTTEVLHQPDGGERYAIVTKFALPGPDGSPAYVAGIGFDITERLQAEEALRESEERFHAIFNLAAVGIAQVTVDGKLLLINQKFCDIIGYTIEEVLQLTAFDISHPDDIERHLAELHKLLQGEIPNYIIEKRLIHKNRSIVWINLTVTLVRDPSGAPEYLIAIVQDINKRKRAEEALRVSEERFRLLADTAPVMIWESGPDGRCTFLNKPWGNYTGKDLEGEKGSYVNGWTEGVHPEDLDRCVSSFLAALKDRREFSMEYRLRRSDGEYGWIVNTAVPRLAPTGELLGYIGTCFDVTERKRVKEALQQDKELLAQKVAERTAELSDTIEKLHEEIDERIRVAQALQAETTERLSVQAELREKELLLLHQSRLAAMGEMIGNIAHQWRQPLNLLGLLAQDLPMTYKLGQFDESYLDTIVKKMLEAIRHMSQTINDFRNFFSPDKEKVDFRVVETIHRTLSLMEGSLNKEGIETTVIAASDPVINGHPNEFSQVILNIISNAKDAVAMRKVPNPVITIEIGSDAGRSVVTITDNAGGIPEDVIGKIFDPYFTTKGPEKGTGVGLYMSKTIIEKNMGGTLDVRNVEGGAQFRIVV